MKNWLYSSETIQSEINGVIRVTRFLGSWDVWVGNSLQTSPYTNAMWKDACKKIAKVRNPKTVKKALLLGLGGGGAVKYLHTYFPSVSVTAVEYDPTMVQLAKSIRLHGRFPFPRVLIGDARDVATKLAETFDLIFLDIFEGKELSSAVTDERFLKSLRSHLSERGVLAVNVSGHRSLIKNIADIFSEGMIWRFRANTLGAFWDSSR